ncbi:MAG: hypothetical protein ABL907_16400 [Hyphomicrobium sp.]
MAFADGELGPAEHARVAEALAGNEDLRRRLAVFMTTGATLADAFKAVAAEPVPRHLLELVRQFPLASEPGAARAPRQESGSGFGWIVERLTAFAGLGGAVAMACSVTAAIGLGAGLYMRAGSPKALPVTASVASANAAVVADGGRIRASGILHEVLETRTSGVRLATQGQAQGNTVVSAHKTFKSPTGYCRQYDLGAADGRWFTGFGCRESDGRWTVTLHTQMPGPRPSNASTVIANPYDEAALTSYIHRATEGDALDNKAEEGIIGGQWKH